MSVSYKKGDLTQQDFDVIGHQTNCLGVMGGGIALTIRNQNPMLFEKYRELCEEKDKELFGHTVVIPADDNRYLVANIFGEYSFTESIAPVTENGRPRHTDYDMLRQALYELVDYMEENNLTTLGLPAKIGCGLAGGDWDGVVLPMILDIFDENPNIDCWIVEYCG